ncbi:chorismate mutase [Chromobacterium vaccinii]|uniref:chorismate mutase n=1 Tax=Chromobacterium vaccinii TaxID=1108595 RepID=A0ABV0F6N9_9NEIS
MRISAIRGAIQVESDGAEAIRLATVSLFERVLSDNKLCDEQIVSLFFTITPDLMRELPPLAIGEAGWGHIPMLCAAEAVSDFYIPRMIRLLAHVCRDDTGQPVQHVYLNNAIASRPAKQS